MYKKYFGGEVVEKLTILLTRLKNRILNIKNNLVEKKKIMNPAFEQSRFARTAKFF